MTAFKFKTSNKVLSVFLALIMVVGLLPMSVFTAFAKEDNTLVTIGDFTISSTDNTSSLTENTDYTYADEVLTITTVTPVTIGMKDGVTATAETVVVDSSNGKVSVTFDGIAIDTEEDAAIAVKGGNEVTFAFVGESKLSAIGNDGINVANNTPFVITSTTGGKLSISGVQFGIYLDGYSTGGSVAVNGDLKLDITDCSSHAIYCRNTGAVTISGTPVINIDATKYALYAHGIDISGGTITVKNDDGYAICSGSGNPITLRGQTDMHITEGNRGLYTQGGKVTITDSVKLKMYGGDANNKTAAILDHAISSDELLIDKNASVDLFTKEDAISGGVTKITDNAQINIKINCESTYSQNAISFDNMTISGNAKVDIDVIKGTKIHGLYDSDGTVDVSGNAVVTIDGTTYKGIYVDTLNLSENASVTVNHKGTSSSYYAIDADVGFSIKDNAQFTATSGDYRVLGDPCTVTPAEGKVYMVQYGASETTATTAYYTATEIINDKSSWRYFSAKTIDFVPITEATVTVNEPEKNGTPDITAEIASDANYTVSDVTWNGNPSKFLGDTEYTATFTLAAKDGFAFIADTTVTVGNATVEKTLNADGTLSVNAKFSATGAAVATNITVATEPNDVEYTYGENFNPSGLVISVTKDDGTTENVTYSDGNKEEFGFSPVDLTVATTKITVTYAGKTAEIDVKVNKAIPEYELPKNLMSVYGETLKNVELPEVGNGVWNWMNADTVVGDAGENTFKLKFTPNDTANYNVVENIDVIVVVSPKVITITAEDKSVIINTKLPIYTYKVEGLIGEDKLVSEPVSTCAADISKIGEYTIDISNADAGKNYTIVYVGAKLTVITDNAVEAAADYAEKLKNYDIATVTSDDKIELDKMLGEIDALLADENITDNGNKALEEIESEVKALLKAIDDAAKAVDTENTEKVKDVTAENVTPGDKTDLTNAKTDFEKALEEKSGNYTTEEKKAIEDEIKRIDGALKVINNVEMVEDKIDNLSENITKDDEAAIKVADDAYNALSDYEKSLVDTDAKKALDDAKATLAELNKPADSNSPQTGDNSNLWMWFVLLFVSGGCLFGIALNECKRKVATKR